MIELFITHISGALEKLAWLKFVQNVDFPPTFVFVEQ